MRLRGPIDTLTYSVLDENSGRIESHTGRELAEGLVLRIGRTSGSLPLRYDPATK